MTEPSPRRPTILLVDDQIEFLQLTRARLTRSALLQVIGEATSGEAALEVVTQLAPGLDLVLLDVEMPDLDGFETARRLRALAPGISIILTSASDNSRYAAAAAGLGVSFLPKRSLSPEAILQLLDRAR